MAPAPSEEPEGLVYQPELLSAREKAELLDELATLRFDPIVLHGRAARRAPLRARLRLRGAHAAAGRADPGLAPAGAGARSGARGARFGRAGGDPRPALPARVHDRLAPRRAGVRDRGRRLPGRLGYVLGGEARSSWQHSIPPTKELRHSITFRTLRR